MSDSPVPCWWTRLAAAQLRDGAAIDVVHQRGDAALQRLERARHFGQLHHPLGQLDVRRLQRAATDARRRRRIDRRRSGFGAEAARLLAAQPDVIAEVDDLELACEDAPGADRAIGLEGD